MKPALTFAILAVVTGAALGDELAIPISVTQITHVKAKPHAFSGVGTFQVLRGEQPLPGSSCPDISNQEGRLVCQVTCDRADSVAKAIRIVPPSRNLRVRGFIAPPSASVEMRGCGITPASVPPFLYRDSQMVLTALLKDYPQLRKIAIPNAPEGGYKFAPIGEALPVMSNLASAKEGTVALVTFDSVAAALAEEAQDSDTAKSELLSKYSIGIHNVLLSKVVEENAGGQVVEGFKISGIKGDYYRNLLLLEDRLDSTAARTPQQNKLLLDLRDMKRRPIDPAHSVKLYGLATRNAARW